MEASKPHPDQQAYIEGPEATRRFTEALRQVVSVSREEYEKRHKQWQKTRKSHRAKAR